LTRTDTRIVTHRWVEQHIKPGTQIAADPSTPDFGGLRVLHLLLPGPKRGFDPNRDVARLRRLGIRNVVVTGAVTDRVLAARDRYPREAAFYDQLRTKSRQVFYLAPSGDLAGPWVAVYGL
jgi:hypothetical protein